MKNLLFLFLSLGLLLASCKKDPAAIQMDNAVQHIPSDATQVTVIRVPQLMQKADFESLREMDFYQEMITEASRENKVAGDILYSPEKSGLDMSKNAYFFVDVNPMNPDQSTAGLLMNMADKAKFEELLKKSPNSSSIQKGDGYSYFTEGSSFVSWNDNIAFLGGGERADVQGVLSRVFDMSEGGSVLSLPAFEQVGGGSDDVSFFMNLDALSESPEVGQSLAMVGWSKDDLKGNTIIGKLNFEDKKMVSTGKFNLGKTIAADLGMPFKSKMSTDFSKYLPDDNLTSAFTFALDSKGLLQLLKEKGLLGLMNMTGGLDQLGITPEQIADAIDGDMALALQSKGSDGKPAGIFCLSIDEKKFEPLLEFLINSQVISGTKGVYTIRDKGIAREFDQALGGDGDANEAQIIIKDNKLFVSADPDLIAGAKDGGLPSGKRMDSSFYNDISKGFLGGKGFPERLKDLMPNGLPKDNGIESFVFYLEDGYSKMEVVSKEEGNFLKSIVKSQGKPQ